MTAPDPDAVVELRGKLANVQFGPAMQALHSDRERAFVFAYASGIATTYADAARLAGYKPENARQLAHQLRMRSGERISKAILEVGRERLVGLLPQALGAAAKVLGDPSHKHHVPMIISVLSKLFGDRTSVDVNVSGSVQIDHTAAAVRDLKQMLELGMPRDRLIEAFGESGLAMYTKLLNAQQQRVIDHQPATASVTAAPNLMESGLEQHEDSVGEPGDGEPAHKPPG